MNDIAADEDTVINSPSSTNRVAAVRAVDLVQVYSAGRNRVVALRGADLVVEQLETVALLGASGAGKSTLLWLLAGLLRPTAGHLHVLGHPIGELDEASLTALRAEHIGVLLQSPVHNLLPHGTALENLSFASPTHGRSKPARELLEAVGLTRRAHDPARSLSGGEQQRLALAVALVNNPLLLLADEPTSQLDRRTAAAILDLLTSLSERYGTTVIAVTHDEATAAAMARTVTIHDGRVGEEGRGGQNFLTVGRAGTVQLPPDTLVDLPPGTLTRLIRRPGQGVDLRRDDTSP